MTTGAMKDYAESFFLAMSTLDGILLDAMSDHLAEEGARMSDYLEGERERDRAEYEFARDVLSPSEFYGALAHDARTRRR